MVWGDVNNHYHNVNRTVNNSNLVVTSSSSKMAKIHNTTLLANNASSGYASALLNHNFNKKDKVIENKNSDSNNKNNNNRNNALKLNPDNNKLAGKQETQFSPPNNDDNIGNVENTNFMYCKKEAIHSNNITSNDNQSSGSPRWHTVPSSSTWNDHKINSQRNNTNPNVKKNINILQSNFVSNKKKSQKMYKSNSNLQNSNNKHSDNINIHNRSHDKKIALTAFPNKNGNNKNNSLSQQPITKINNKNNINSNNNSNNDNSDKKIKNKVNKGTSSQKKTIKPSNKKKISLTPKKQKERNNSNNSEQVPNLMDFPALTSNIDFPNLSNSVAATSMKPSNHTKSSKNAQDLTTADSPPSCQNDAKKSTNSSIASKKTLMKNSVSSPRKKNKNNTTNTNHANIDKAALQPKHLKAKNNIQNSSVSLLSKNIGKSDYITNRNKHFAVDNFISLPVKNSTTSHGQLKTQGRQRLGPRKKRLTTLKKRVLQERLAQYRQANNVTNNDSDICMGSVNDQISGDKETEKSTLLAIQGDMNFNSSNLSLCILNFINGEDELQDEDEYEEMCTDLQDLAQKVGSVDFVWIPRSSADNTSCYAFVKFQKLEDAQAAHSIWEGMMIAGNRLEVHFVHTAVKFPQSKQEWQSQVSTFTPPHNNSIGSSDEKYVTNSPVDSCNEVSFVLLENILTEDDYEDEECLEESIQDIIALASEFGSVVKEKVKMVLGGAVLIPYSDQKDLVKGIIKSLNSMTIGGSTISAKLLLPTIVLDNIFTQDDYDDVDCFEETKQDIKSLLQQPQHYGTNLTDVTIMNNNNCSNEGGQILVTYDSFDIANLAVQSLNDGVILGGCQISAKVNFPTEYLQSPATKPCEEPNIMIIENIFTEDDLEDEDCLEETKEDIIALASKYGRVKSMEVKITETEKNHVSIAYDDVSDMHQAIAEINGMVIGGLTIIAYSKSKNQNIKSKSFAVKSFSSTNNISSNTKASLAGEDKKIDDLPPIFSNEKIIPEKYAACKRVPKIPNKGVPREYALTSRIDNENAVPLIFEMLGELMRLQIRNKDDKNARARRRLVMGFREVARGIRAHKIKMVIMANNLDEYGAIDSKLQSILDMAKEDDLPVIFELNKRKLGKALGKSIKVGIVGIQNADGAHEPFKKLKKLMGVY